MGSKSWNLFFRQALNMTVSKKVQFLYMLNAVKALVAQLPTKRQPAFATA